MMKRNNFPKIAGLFSLALLSLILFSIVLSGACRQALDSPADLVGKAELRLSITEPRTVFPDGDLHHTVRLTATGMTPVHGQR